MRIPGRGRLAIACTTLASSAVVVWAAPGESAESERSYVAARLRSKPQVDGQLDDAAWTAARADDRFTQRFPAEGALPTEHTEFRVGFDDDALYVAVRLNDTEPDAVRARLTRRDRPVEADWVRVAIDSRGDQEGAYVFMLNAAGVQTDGVIYDDTEFSADWDGVWDGAVAHDARGWSAEFRIPFSVLRFPARGANWGLQVDRYISRKKERVSWRYTRSDERGEASRMGTLLGLSGLEPRHAVELRPFGLVTVGRRPIGGLQGGAADRGAFGFDAQLGLDAKLGLTSDLVLDITVNPDYGQIEADQLVLNLTGFETFYPEKRAFFLEGLDMMQSPLTVFYPRRIGQPPNAPAIGDSLLAPDGRELEVTSTSDQLSLWGAAKLAGKITRHQAVAILAAVTGPEQVETMSNDAAGRLTLAPPRLFLIGRGRWAFGSASYLGVFATAVDRLGDKHIFNAALDHDAFTQGVDGRWQSTDATFRLGGQLMTSERWNGPSSRDVLGGPCVKDAGECVPLTSSEGARWLGDDVGAGGRGSAEVFYKGVAAKLEWESLSPRFDLNALGFQTFAGVHHGTLSVGYQRSLGVEYLQSYSLKLASDIYYAFDGTPQWWANEARGELETKSFWKLRWGSGLAQGNGWWDRRETRGDGARLERPRMWFGDLGVASDTRQMISADVAASGFVKAGGAWGTEVTVAVAARPASNLELDANADAGTDLRARRFYDCTTPEGHACTVETPMRGYHFASLDSAFASFTMRGTYTLSTRLSLQGTSQLFLSRGAYHSFMDIETIGANPYIRFAEMTPSSYLGDANGNGVPDANFAEAALNAQVLLRWEPTRGASVYLAYNRRERAAPTDVPARRLEPGRLAEARVEELIFLKWVHYISL